MTGLKSREDAILRELLGCPPSGNLADMIERAKQARELALELRKANGRRVITGEFSKWRARH